MKGLVDVKPEYVVEYEYLQKDLEKLHELYVSKHVNLDFLDHELDQFVRRDAKRKEKIDVVIMHFKAMELQQQKSELFEDGDSEENETEFSDDQMRKASVSEFMENQRRQSTEEDGGVAGQGLRKWRSVSDETDEEEESSSGG